MMLHVKRVALAFVLLTTPFVFVACNDLQNQIFNLLGGSSNLVRDNYGIVCPPYPEAVEWLQAFWETGLHHNTSLLTTHRQQDLQAPTAASANKGSWSWSSWLFGPQANALSSPQYPSIVCGVPEGMQIERKNVLLAPVGDFWSAEKWLSHPDITTFDVIAIYHGDNESFSCPLCAAVFHIKGPKWRLYYELTSNDELWKPIAERYDRIMLPDDDLEMDTCTINQVFSTMKEFDLLLAQPSVCEHNGAEGTWRPELHQRVQYVLRYTTFVEVMAPTFRMDFFNAVVRRTLSKYWTYVGWGLDSVWPAMLHYPKDRIAIVDAVCMTHVPSEGGLGAGIKPNSIYRPGLSPYSAKQEELIVFSAFNYSATTTAALGQPFMSSRILGAVPNPEVSNALSRSIGSRPRSFGPSRAPGPSTSSSSAESFTPSETLTSLSGPYFKSGIPTSMQVVLGGTAAVATLVVSGRSCGGFGRGRGRPGHWRQRNGSSGGIGVNGINGGRATSPPRTVHEGLLSLSVVEAGKVA